MYFWKRVYLNIGTGKAWASQVKANVLAWPPKIVNVEATLGNEGALKPMGSIRKVQILFNDFSYNKRWMLGGRASLKFQSLQNSDFNNSVYKIQNFKCTFFFDWGMS